MVVGLDLVISFLSNYWISCTGALQQASGYVVAAAAADASSLLETQINTLCFKSLTSSAQLELDVLLLVAACSTSLMCYT